VIKIFNLNEAMNCPYIEYTACNN